MLGFVGYITGSFLEDRRALMATRRVKSKKDRAAALKNHRLLIFQQPVISISGRSPADYGIAGERCRKSA